jgi:hypothetical protein
MKKAERVSRKEMERRWFAWFFSESERQMLRDLKAQVAENERRRRATRDGVTGDPEEET